MVGQFPDGMMVWPLSGGPPSSFVKESSGPSEAPEISITFLVTEIQTQMSKWAMEMPGGIEKVAARRLGTDEDLPAVTTKGPRANIWRHPHAHPLVLTLLLLDKYKKEYLDWAPETLRETLRRDGVLISNSVWTKIQAMRVVLTVPSPWRQWEVFHWVSLGLNGDPPNFVYMEQAQLAYLVVAVDIMNIADKAREFGDDLDKFVATVLKNAGVAYAPSPLDFAQRELDDPQISCPDCGLEDRDDHDVKCISCGSVNLERMPGEFDELRDATKAEFDKRRGMPLERAESGLKEDGVGVATLRLLAHWDYRNQVRAQLVAQLQSIASS